MTVTRQKAQGFPNRTKCSLPARHQRMLSCCTSQNDLPFIKPQPQITRKFLQLTRAHVVNPVQTAQKYKQLAAIDQMKKLVNDTINHFFRCPPQHQFEKKKKKAIKGSLLSNVLHHLPQPIRRGVCHQPLLHLSFPEKDEVILKTFYLL